jgi:hypothetical protein
MKRNNIIYDDRIHRVFNNNNILFKNGGINPLTSTRIIFTDYGYPTLKYNGINIYDIDQIKLTWNAVSEELITKLDNLELLKNKI